MRPPILVYLQILQLFKDGVMREDEDQVVFERDHLFKTPSMAAAFVMARSANG